MKQERPSYGEQLQAAYHKFQKARNIEGMAYYRSLGNTCAAVSFETFRGTAAYILWKQKPEIKTLMAEIEKELKRFAFWS